MTSVLIFVTIASFVVQFYTSFNLVKSVKESNNNKCVYECKIKESEIKKNVKKENLKEPDGNLSGFHQKVAEMKQSEFTPLP